MKKKKILLLLQNNSLIIIHPNAIKVAFALINRYIIYPILIIIIPLNIIIVNKLIKNIFLTEKLSIN